MTTEFFLTGGILRQNTLLVAKIFGIHHRIHHPRGYAPAYDYELLLHSKMITCQDFLEYLEHMSKQSVEDLQGTQEEHMVLPAKTALKIYEILQDAA